MHVTYIILGIIIGLGVCSVFALSEYSASKKLKYVLNIPQHF